MWPIGRPPQWVGRTQELAVLRAATDALGRGEGAAVWVEGEPGIGKSSLVAEALAVARNPGWEIEWGMADQLTKRLPLRVMLDCLQVRPGSPDPRRARAADLLRSRRPGLFAGGDASVSGVEVLVTLVDELCAAAPTVIVVDDLQWADEASLVVWHQLAASIGQSRLLLIGTCRPVPRRHQVQQLRAAVVRRGGAVVTLGPLPETDVAALVTAMVGAPPADGLRALTAQAAGNPLYVRELVDALVREQALQISPIAEITRTGEQLSAAGRPGGGWAHAWLIQAAPTLTTRAPQLAAELLRRELEETPADKEAWNALVAGLVRALLAAGSYAEAARQARRALEVMTDPARRGQTSWMLARAQVSAGENDDAMATIRQALAPNGVPGEWRARMLALLAMLERAGAVDLDAVDATARQALAIAGELGDAFAAAHALADLWLTHGVRRDHAGALDYLDRALRVLGDDPSYADLRSFVLDVRVFTLQNLDRWPDAELALRQAREFAQRTGSPDSATWATAAVLRYWLGQWDDVLAELGFDDTGTDAYLRERWPALLSHGVAALIAGRRDQRTAAAEQLRQGLVLPIQTLPDRENQDFLVAAHALALEQDGRPTRP
jgi:tetratricopeptide (TPR) repeat protein